jgi:hypothetical protein
MRGDGDAKAKPAVDVSAFVAGLKEALPAIEADAEASDPKALRAEIARLRRELAAKAPAIDAEAVRQEGYAHGLRDGGAILAQVRRDIAKVADELGRMVSALADAAPPPVDSRPARRVAPTAAPARPTPRPVVRGGLAPNRPSSTLPIGEKAVLAAVAQYPNGLRREQLTVLTGYKRSSRDQYIARLRVRKLVSQNGERVCVTSEGLDALGSDYEPPLHGQALRDRVLSKLPEGERSILNDVIWHYPAIISRDAIGETAGYKRSTRDQYILRLRARELIEVSRDGVRAVDTLFMEAAA